MFCSFYFGSDLVCNLMMFPHLCITAYRSVLLSLLVIPQSRKLSLPPYSLHTPLSQGSPLMDGRKR